VNKAKPVFFALFSLLIAASCSRKLEVPTDRVVVRCAVVGGMTMIGLWPQIAQKFEAQTGYRAEVVATGSRLVLDAAMRAGKVDFLTMHSGDITTDSTDKPMAPGRSFFQ
jgi:tungstate transport system substrate-binding protein